MGAMITLPNAATPADRILARFNRDQLAGFIEVAISLLDAADAPGDPEAPNFTPRCDAMPGDPADAEPCGDDRGDVSWSEWQTRGNRKLVGQGPLASEPMMRADGTGMAREDDEDDDPVEENGDEQDTGHAEDEELSGTAAHWGRYWNGGRAGCPISDPCGGHGEEVNHACLTFGVDQTARVSEVEAFHDLNEIPLIRVPQPENDQ